jgi:large subunit ribosomal protein L29
MKAKELRAMDKEELKKKYAELRLELIKHNSQIATGTIPKSPGLVRNTKRTIARILTVLAANRNKKQEAERKQ